jgi:hypothetical protein
MLAWKRWKKSTVKQFREKEEKMKKLMFLLVGILLALSVTSPRAASSFDGIPGATDKVPAATLICPFFEVGIDGTGNGDDTLLMVTNTSASNKKFHYHVWDIDGKATDLEGNADIVTRGIWVMSMKTLMATASAATKSDLTVGSFYQGFVTIDMVTADTHDDPTSASYPFSNTDYLEGYIYYINLSAGMSNGIDMIPLEYVSGVADPSLMDFYNNSDGRERIDSDARECAKDLIDGNACSNNDYIDYIDSRVYLTPPNGSSRIVIFTWSPGLTIGPSTWCAANGCTADLPFKQYNQSGTLVSPVTETIQLTRAVNVIEVTGTTNGWVRIEDVPSGIAGYQVFAFVFNNEKSATASLNYVAILESYMRP